jgi:hypothetical protein
MTGEALRVWRKKYHLSQAMMGRLLGGYPAYTICRMEQSVVAIPPACVLLLWLLDNPTVRAATAAKVGVILPTTA